MFGKAMLLPLVCVINTAYTQPVARAVWLDTDIRLGKPGRDVDDGLALIMVLQAKEIHVEGISVIGNVGYASSIVQKLVRKYGVEPFAPVYKGAKNFKALGKETNATTALIQKLLQKKLTIVALGPLTNIATVIQNHPELATQVQEIFFCGGRHIGLHFNIGSSTLNIPDINFERDPYAFNILLQAGIPITFTGFEAAKQVKIYKQDILFLKNSPDKASHWLYKKLHLWQMLWKIVLNTECFIPFDVMTLGSLIAPRFFHFNNSVAVRIDTSQNDLFIPLLTHKTKPYLNIINNPRHDDSIYRYCNKTDLLFKDYFLLCLHQMVDTISLKAYFPASITPPSPRLQRGLTISQIQY